MDARQILGVGPRATLSEIKAAYRRLARESHPDLNPGDKAAEARFRDGTLAYKALLDELANAPSQQPPQAPERQPAPYQPPPAPPSTGHPPPPEPEGWWVGWRPPPPAWGGPQIEAYLFDGYREACAFLAGRSYYRGFRLDEIPTATGYRVQVVLIR